MAADGELIGRERERAELDRALAAAREGYGGLVLLAGEAGVGKTRLAEVCLAGSGLSVVGGIALQEATPPYGPLVAALRAYLRTAPDGLADCGPLAPYLALLLPELGPAPAGGDPATLFEALRAAFAAIARRHPAVIFLDDLQWADNATLELLPPLAGALSGESLLVVGAYRSDEVPRGHPLRRARTELRRLRRLHEIAVAPLGPAESAIVAARVLGAPPGPALAAALYDRTQGVPFFVEELAAALAAGGRLRRSGTGVELAAGDGVPLPDSVRDAVLLRAEALSDAARAALEIAAVAGLQVDLDLVAELTGNEAGIEEAIARGLLIEAVPGQTAFRHALAREAIYGEIGWSRRRALHQEIAARLEAHGAPPALVAEHWLAARERARARRALLAAAAASSTIHAYRDAARAIQRALEFWPEGEEAERLAALDRLGQCAELSGDLAGALRAWREAAEGRRLAGDTRGAAEAERRLASVYELQGAWERALAARQAAAEGFATAGLPAEAAAERLAVAAHLQAAGRLSAALASAGAAVVVAEGAGRADLLARALGIEGLVRVKLGETETGLALLHRGLALALDHDLGGPAAEIYQRLAVALEHAADYPGARDALRTAVAFCEEQGATAMAQFCLACLAVILYRTGEWDQAVEIWRGILADTGASPAGRTIAATMLGTIHAHRGETKRARTLLGEGLPRAQRDEFLPPELIAMWTLALTADVEGNVEAAAEHGRAVLARWEETEDRHYVIFILHWAVTFFATGGMAADARACAQAMARIAAEGGNPEALATLAHALGEAALLDGDAGTAVAHFSAALERLRELDLPLEAAQTALRAGVALAATGARAAAVERLTDAYRTALRLGARPLAAQVARELAALGEPVERRLGRRAAGQMQRAGLSERELETLRLVAVGRTNREIARTLFLSPRTVDMHVRNILAKLDCRSRAEAIHRAGGLGLLAAPED